MNEPVFERQTTEIFEILNVFHMKQKKNKVSRHMFVISIVSLYINIQQQHKLTKTTTNKKKAQKPDTKSSIYWMKKIFTIIFYRTEQNHLLKWKIYLAFDWINTKQKAECGMCVYVFLMCHWHFTYQFSFLLKFY